MELTAVNAPLLALRNLGIRNNHIHYQLSPELLAEQTVYRHQGELSDNGALCVHTGKFTGRSPQDKFIVKDQETAYTVNWNQFNIPIEESHFLNLRSKLTAYLSAQPELWVRDCIACAHPDFQLRIRVVNETPWSNLFAHNLFLCPAESELSHFSPEWTIMQAPGFEADPLLDGTRSPHFAIISFAHKTILIGGTGYTGEMKKGIFTVLNYLLPHHRNVLSMHCSANMDEAGDTAIFFGLSGTGKTTLSADPNRLLIGDDEHGWTDEGIFNFEGGCYAKCIDLTQEKEPQIFAAIREGSLVENTCFFQGTHTIDFSSKAITENTRVSYPLHFIGNAADPAQGQHPRNIFFLTCDAYGVLPPISKLTPAQAMYHFVSGYTARVAGTEAGVSEPKATFSACFGAPFLPLHAGRYAEMLGQRMREHRTNVWLINTGWTGGPYGTGRRINLAYTRAMIAAVLHNRLERVDYETHPVFGLHMPKICPGVPFTLLNPRYTWANREAYDRQANMLAGLFRQNFEKYASGVPAEVIMASPKTT